MSAIFDLDLTSDPRSIIGTRVYDAPRELVFAAFSDPKHLANWWGPNGFTTTTHSFAFKPGGAWRFTMHGPDGRDYENLVTYDEIVAPERLSYRHGGDDSEPVLFVTTLTFEDLVGKTRLTWHGRFPTAEERARVLKEHGAGEGLVQTMGRLAQHLATLH